MDASTPAGRLLGIFDEVRSIGRDLPYRSVWAAALGYDVNTVGEVEHMTELGTLLRNVYFAATSVAESGTGYDRDGLLHGYQSWCAVVYGWNAVLGSNHLYSGTAVIPDTVRNSLASTHGQLRGVLKEGTLPLGRRDELLDHVGHITRDLIGDVTVEAGLPDELRVRLTARLVEVREIIAMVRYRGDQAVIDAINVTSIDFAAAVASASQSLAPTPVQERLIEWSATLRTISFNLTQALSIPTAVGYFLATNDPQGAGIIASAGTPGAVGSAISKVLSVTRGSVPPAIESSTDGGDDRTT